MLYARNTRRFLAGDQRKFHAFAFFVMVVIGGAREEIYATQMLHGRIGFTRTYIGKENYIS